MRDVIGSNLLAGMEVSMDSEPYSNDLRECVALRRARYRCGGSCAMRA